MSIDRSGAGLFSPLQIGRMEVRNRLLSTAHLTNFAEAGLPTDRHLAYWREKARGGIGLIITEGSLVHPSSRTPETRFIELWRDEVVEPLRRVSKAIHAHGARLVAQLNHMGMSWAPSPWLRPNGLRAHEMTRAEVAEVVQAFALAAERVRAAGLDGVEIHASHGYLIEQFLSPVTNQREDDYGGSEENRERLLSEVLESVRARVGEEFVVGIRVTGDQYTPGGLDQEDMARIVGHVVGHHAVDFVNVSLYRSHQYGPAGNSIVPMYVPPGSFVHLAEAIGRVVDVPVFCVNRIVDPRMAEEIIAEGRADMVAMTRAQIADPHLAEKAQQGRYDEIRPCIGINEGCMGQVMSGSASPLTCAVNPSAGHEHEPAVPVQAVRTVAVVGGGIAGMEVARLAADRGHRVTLHERSGRPGGQLLVAARIPGLAGMARPVDWYLRQFELLGVDVRLHSSPDAELLAGSDVVVVATGSRGADWREGGLYREPGMAWLTVREAFDADLAGKRVLVHTTDQSLEPLGLADRLAESGSTVTLTTTAHTVGGQVENVTRPFVLDRLASNGVGIHVLSTLRIDQHGTPHLTRGDAGNDRTRVSEDYDVLVLGFGSMAEDRLYRQLDSRHQETHLVGDAYAPRRIVAATQQAWSVGSRL